MKMQNTTSSPSTSIVDFELRLFNNVITVNMLAVSTITLYYVFKATPPFNDTSVKRNVCDSCATLRQLHFLVLSQT